MGTASTSDRLGGSAARTELAKWRAWSAPLLVGIVGLLVAYFMTFALYTQAQDKRVAIARAQAQAAAEAVRSQLGDAAQAVNNLTAFFSASSEVTVNDFELFSQRLMMRQPFLAALQYSPVVERADRQAFERQLAQRGFPAGITTHSEDAQGPAPEADYYLPILLQEPVAGNEKVFGMDLLTRPYSQALIEQALRYDSPQVGPPITLVQSGEPAWLVYSPVYRRGAPTGTFEQRQAALQGVGGAVFLYEQAFGAISVNPQTEQVILVGDPQETAEVLASSSGLSAEQTAQAVSWPVRGNIDFEGWQARVYTRPAGWGLAPALALAVGALLALLVGLLVALILRTTAHRKVRELAGRLAIANQDLIFRNSHDVLTGLRTREVASDLLADWIARPTSRRPRVISALFVDLDRFGWVNSTWGHAEGDRVLRQIAVRLEGLAESGASAFRVGGDAFLLLRRGRADEEPGQDLDHILRELARQVQEVVSAPVQVGQSRQIFTCSVGIATYPQDASTAEDLIAHADAAVRAGKADGTAQIKMFNQGVAAEELERAEMEREMAQALRRPAESFQITYQPQVDMVSGEVVGIEALVRMRGRRWPPDSFIPVVESAGMIAVLGRWVLEETLAQVQRWRESGLRVPTVSVNVSIRQLVDTDLAALSVELLDRHGLERTALRLEVTESAVMEQGSAEVLARTRAAGVALSIDDFGTGYSSLSRLATLSVDELKIDASFVAMLPDDDEAFEVVRLVADLGRVYGLSVVAEGVENREQSRVLLDAGLRIAQGFFYSAPLEPAAMVEFLLASQAEAAQSVAVSPMDLQN